MGTGAGAKLAAIIKLRRIVSAPKQQHDSVSVGGAAAAGQGGGINKENGT
jgi:hypothetical protein